MENFIYSINATIPIFLVMMVGYVFRQTGMLSEEFVKAANRFNFNVTLPCLLLVDMAKADFKEHFDFQFVLFCAVATTVCFAGVWIVSKIVLKDQSMVGAFVQASFRSSAAVMGVAFIQNIYGSASIAPLMMIGCVPLYNIYSVIVLTFESAGQSGKKDFQTIRRAVVNILKNPIIISIFAGLLLSVAGISFPTVADKTLTSIAAMASPLALVALGAGFEGRGAVAKIRPTLAASLIKLVLQAAIFLPVAVHMGFRGEKIIALVIMLAAPATPSCYIMAQNMKNDGVLTASIVVATTLFASVTMTGWIFLLRSMGLV